MRGFVDWPDDAITSITQPTLFVSGTDDIVRPEHTVAMGTLAPRGWSLVLPGGHGDFFSTSDGAVPTSGIVPAFSDVVDVFLGTDDI